MIDFNTIIPRLKELYVSNTERFVMMKNGLIFTPKFGGRYKRLDDAALYSHLTHTMTVCVFAGERGTKFACLDVDIDDHELLRRVILGLAICPRVYTSFWGIPMIDFKSYDRRSYF